MMIMGEGKEVVVTVRSCLLLIFCYLPNILILPLVVVALVPSATFVAGSAGVL